LIYLLKLVIFHSYVKLPEGNEDLVQHKPCAIVKSWDDDPCEMTQLAVSLEIKRVHTDPNKNGHQYASNIIHE
jgi:hypothetical protein